MELKLLDLIRRSEKSQDDEGDFVLELTIDELARVGGGMSHDDESPKETRYR